MEGPTERLDVTGLRDRLKRNFLATLVFSQGVPMLLAGDEIGRTQRGNNNAYCQDDETSWLDWQLSARQQELLRYTRQLVEIRRSNPVLRRRSFFGARVSSTRREGRDLVAPRRRRDGGSGLGRCRRTTCSA